MLLDPRDAPTRRRLRRAAPWLVAASVAALGGCGGGSTAMSDPDQIRANFSRYGNAVLDGDGKTACALIVEANRRALERTSSDGSCAGVIEEFQALRSGDAKRICSVGSVREAMPAGTSVEDCVREMQAAPQILAQMSASLKKLDTALRDAGGRLTGLKVTGDDAQAKVTLAGTSQTIRFKRVDGKWLVSSPEVLTTSGS